MKRIPITLVGLALFGLVTSCYDFSKFDNITIDPVDTDMAFPVIKSTITFKELVERGDENTIVGIDSLTNEFYVSFRDTNEFGLASNQFSIPSQAFSAGVDWPYPSIPASNTDDTLHFEDSFTESFSAINGVEIKSVELNSGLLEINMVNTFSHPVEGMLVLSSLRYSNGDTIKVPFRMDNNTPTFNTSISLADRYIYLYKENPVQYNVFDYKVSVNILLNSFSGVSTGQGVDVNLSISGLDFNEIRGAFNYVFDTDYLFSSLDMFNSAYVAQMHLTKPMIKLTLLNGFGVPASLSLLKFEFVNTNNAATINVQNEGALTENDLKISLPNNLAPATETIPYDTSVFNLNATNSNIEDVFDIAPNQLNFAARFNLGDGSANHNQFVRRDSKINFISFIKVPLEGWATTLLLRDTLENIDWPAIDDFGEIDEQSLKIDLRFMFNNGLPLDLNVQVRFADANGTELTTLFDDKILFDDNGLTPFLKSAPISATGESAGKTPNVVNASIDKAKYDLISLATQMILEYKVNTGEEGKRDVKILPTDEIDLLLTVRMKGTIKPNK